MTEGTVEMLDEITAHAPDGRRVGEAVDEELVDAAMAYAEAEKRRAMFAGRRGQRTCAEWDAINRVYRCEKRLHALFCAGERSDMLNRMYNEYIRMLLNPPEPQA
jgi:hypothetical protein